ncbi:hypothetical protein, partial [Dialister sp. CAG:357]|uniref:hypothetical protein n=1 Tax=Dialister sp. CAG:357 TaxID=1262869 RepID=UPI00258AFC54
GKGDRFAVDRVNYRQPEAGFMVSKGAVISKRIGLITNSRRYISLRQIRTELFYFFIAELPPRGKWRR